jgi:glycerol kinase
VLHSPQMKTILAIDQGTTSSRAILYDENLRVLSCAQKEFAQHYPSPGRVEHDAREIWDSVRYTTAEALDAAGLGAPQVTCVGITNQRETIVLWDRSTGEPVHRALVWQDRRTADFLEELRCAGKEQMIRERTGLVLDPYFSAGKLRWLLQNVPDGFERAGKGELAAGTIDSWLIYKLTGGNTHITDPGNASRTMLMNLHTAEWDPELLALFDVESGLMPRIVPSSGNLALTCPATFGAAVPITGILGDQQAALFGQHCIRPGQLKCTYGTGCFLLAHTGEKPIPSAHRLLSTAAWKIADAPMQYAMEGSVFMGGATIQWLRDGLRIIASAADINGLAGSVSDSGGVVFVPAFTGLGAPYWDPAATGTLLGLTRGTTSAHIARAALDGIASQVADVVDAMARDTGRKISLLRVDGGACASDLLMQLQADLLGVEVERPRNIESTALGAAMMAGLGAGIWPDVDTLGNIRKIDCSFHPGISPKERSAKRRIWKKAVRRARSWNP